MTHVRKEDCSPWTPYYGSDGGRSSDHADIKGSLQRACKNDYVIENVILLKNTWSQWKNLCLAQSI